MTDRNLSEEQARALWERAARLQAEAAAQEMAPAQPEQPERDSSGDYSMDVVRRSAMEAGISEEFIEEALRELAPSGQPPRKTDDWADRFLGDDQRMVRLTRVIDKPIEEVFEAMRRVLPNAPFGLSLAGIRGGDPLEGGVMTFEVPSMSGMGGGIATNKAVFAIRHWADIPEIQFRLRALPGDSPRTELECSAALAHARRMNYWAGISIAGMVGIVVAGIGGAIGAALIGPAAVALKLGVVGGSGVAGYLGMARGFRHIYRFGQRKGYEGMDRLIDAIVVDMQTGGAFTPRLEPRSEISTGRKLLDDLSI